MMLWAQMRYVTKLLKFDALKPMDDIVMKASAREMFFHEISESLKFLMKATAGLALW